jgi:hypothetical protein
MALLNAIRPTAAGVAWSPGVVSSSDTIAQGDLGQLGAVLVVINAGGSADTVTISDAGRSPAGNAATPATVTVPAASARTIYINPRSVDPVTGVVTVTHSFTTSVTCALVAMG